MDFHSFPIPITIFVLVLLSIIYHYIFKTENKNKNNSLPEPGGAWPVLGHFPMLATGAPPHVTLGRWADEIGPIFGVRMGVKRILIISDSKIAKECFTTSDKVFTGRPKAVALEHLTYNYAMFGFSPYGDYWRHLRKITTLELLSDHRLRSLSGARESEARAAVRELYERWWNDSRVLVDMKKWFGDLTLNASLRMIVGKRSAGPEGGERLRPAIRAVFGLIGTFVVGDAVPWLRWLDFGGYEKAMAKTAMELDQILNGFLDEHKEEKKKKKRKRMMGCDELGDEEQEDFMGVLLSVLDDHAEEISGYDVDTINKATCLSLILGGTDTTALTLSWALALLLNNKETLIKTQQELDDHVGRERQVNASDIPKLVYLQAVVKETFRLHPPAPLLAGRALTEDCTVAGFHVPAGALLFVNASKLQRDPAVWPDPGEFRPERFLGERRNVDVRGQSFELLPFGSGRRMCPGVSFALEVITLGLASLLHGFEIATSSGEPIELREAVGLSNLIASPVDVLVTPRLPARAYYY